MHLSSFLFWDTDPSTLDYEKSITYIIPRVMDYGTMDDIREVYEYYGSDRILKVLLAAPSLDKKTISYFAWEYGISRHEFRSYRHKQEWKTWK